MKWLYNNYIFLISSGPLLVIFILPWFWKFKVNEKFPQFEMYEEYILPKSIFSQRYIFSVLDKKKEKLENSFLIYMPIEIFQKKMSWVKILPKVWGPQVYVLPTLDKFLSFIKDLYGLNHDKWNFVNSLNWSMRKI